MIKGPWMTGEALTQADITVVCFWDFIVKNRQDSALVMNCAQLTALSKRANAMQEFAQTNAAKGSDGAPPDGGPPVTGSAWNEH